MQYRDFGKLGWKVSALGFGAMRLPLAGPNQKDVNVPEAIRMIRYAIDHGVNYVDTAYPYHEGVSEQVVGQALKDGYRAKAKVATKLLPRLVEKVADFDRVFNEQLTRLQLDRVDFYLLHGLNAPDWKKLRDLGVLGWAEKQMAAGRIGRLGFSFHDEFEVFKSIVDGYDHWALAQVQYNYMDVDKQAGRKGVEYAAGKGLAVVAMEPLRGGMLTKAPPSVVAKIWETAHRQRSLAEWGLLWIWDQPEISLVLSGMSTFGQVEENIRIADKSRPGLMDAEDLALIDRVRKAFVTLRPVPCTRCNYCQPCPSGVAIPRIFTLFNEVSMYDNWKFGRMGYVMGLTPEQRADKCTECGECVEKCPQKIDVPAWLKKVHAALAA
jgi:hypothetical protein